MRLRMKERLARVRGVLARRHAAPPALLLDFAARQAQRRGMAISVLAGGALLFGLAQWQSEQAQLALEAAEQALQQHSGNPREKPARPVERERLQESEINEQVARANGIIRQLALPWDRLFEALEKASSRDVAVLSIEPDPSRGLLRAGAEAKNAKAMFAYLQGLGKSGFLQDPVLLSHQLRQEDPLRPIQFTFSASWQTNSTAGR